jgi:RHS repeat-associated protein
MDFTVMSSFRSSIVSILSTLSILSICLSPSAANAAVQFEHDPLPLSVTDGVICGNVCGVCTITGAWSDVDVDMVVAGPEPLVLERTYQSNVHAPPWKDKLDNPDSNTISPSWQHNCFNTAFRFSNSRHCALVKDPCGGCFIYSAPYVDNVPKENLKILLSKDTKGLTNCGRGEIGGRTHPKNTVIQLPASAPVAVLCSGDKCTYSQLRKGGDFWYFLTKWQHATGNQTDYTYNGEDKVSKVVFSNSQREVCSWLEFNHPKNKHFPKERNISVQTSDGRSVSYRYIEANNWTEGIGMTHYLQQVTRSNAPTINYEYTFTTLPEEYTIGRVSRKNFPNQRYIGIEYFEWVKDRIYLNDPRLGRVKQLTAPVGESSSPVATYRFDYHVEKQDRRYPNKKYPGSTEVYDAHNHKTHYHFNGDLRLTHVQRFTGTNGYALYATDRFVWGSGSNECNLMTRFLEDPTGRILVARSLFYDGKGNVFYDQICGDLSGNGGGNIQLDGNGYPIDNGAERQITVKTYTQDEFNLPLSEFDGRRKTTRYQYVPGKNLLAAKFICEEATIRIREFYTYDKNAVLIETVVDNGNSENKHDLTHVTQRRIVRVVPKEHPPFMGLPLIVEESYWDPETQVERPLKKTVNAYSLQGWLTKQEVYDAEGAHRYTLTWEYDGLGNVIRETDPLGYVTLCTYDGNSNLESVRRPRGNQKKYTYDFSNRCTKEEDFDIDGSLLTMRHRYDTLSHKIETTDPFWQKTSYVYDDFSRLVATKLPSVPDETGLLTESVLRQEYNLLNQISRQIDPKGEVTHFRSNIRNQPTYTHYPDGTEESIVYDMYGLALSHKARNNTLTLYTYDFLGRITQEAVYSQTGELLKTTERTYDAFQLRSMTDPEGNVTHYHYDGAGRQIGETRGERTIRYVYDTLGRKVQVIQGDTLLLFEYDLKNQLIEERTETQGGHLQKYTAYGYDADGNCIRIFQKSSDGDIVQTQMEYNGRGQVIQRTDPLGNVTHVTYNTAFLNSYGQTVLQKTETDPLGTQTVTTMDTHGRIAAVEKYNPFAALIHKEDHFYTLNNKRARSVYALLSSEEQKSISTLWEYTATGELLHLIEAKGTAEEKHTYHAYNSYGQKATTQKPDGVKIFYTYTPLGELETLQASDETISYRYHYNRLSNVLQIDDLVQGTTTQRDYNAYGQVTKETQAHGYVFENTFDAQGRPQAVHLPTGSPITYTYEGIYLHEVSYKHLSHQYLAYDTNGGLLKARHPEKAGESEIVYDKLHRPLSWKTPPYVQNHFQYDPAGNLLSYDTQDPLGSVENRFCYDDRYQIQSEEGTAPHHYAHDSLYNRCSKDTVSYAHNSLNQLLSQGEVHYTYDPNGNLTSIQAGEQHVNCIYAALDRLVTLEKEDSKIHYTYDPFNRRLTKTKEELIYPTWTDFFSDYKTWVKQSETHYLYQGQKEIGTFENGELKELRILGLGRGAEIGAAIALYLEGQWKIPLHDHRGNVTVLLDSEGELLETYRYTAFGEELLFDRWNTPIEKVSNPWRFGSKRKDADTGWICFGRRDYDPAIGRWMTPDPLGFEDGPNLYAYVCNHPLGYIDPWGLSGAGLHVRGERWETPRPGVSESSRSRDRVAEERRDDRHSSPGVIQNDIRATTTFNSHFSCRQLFHEMERVLSEAAWSVACVFFDPSNLVSNVHTVGSCWVARNERIIYVNGMNVPFAEAMMQAHQISQKHGGQYVSLVYNSTRTPVVDMIECACEKKGYATQNVVLTQKLLHQAVNEIEGLPGGRVNLYGFSEGAIICCAGLDAMSPEERRSIYAMTIGGGQMVDHADMGGIDNVVASRDWVSMCAAPIGIVNGLKNGTVRIVPSEEQVWVDHMFLSEAYKGVVSEYGGEFMRRNHSR